MAYRADEEGSGYIPPDSQSQPQSDPFYDQVEALYAKYGRTPTPEEVQSHRGNPGGLSAIEQMLIQARDSANKQPMPDVQVGNGGGGGGGGGLGSSIGSLIAPYTGSGFAAPASVNLGGPAGIPYIPPTPQFHAPSYTPPPAFSYEGFKAPTGETVLNEPGFKFGLDQGLQGLQQSAAARGVLNGGGTLKDVAAWAQNYAGGKFSDAYNREANTYGMNRANAYGNYQTNVLHQNIEPYQFAFQGAQSEFAPQLQGYATQAAAGQRQNESNYGNAMALYQDDYKRYLDSQQLLYNYRAPFLQG